MTDGGRAGRLVWLAVVAFCGVLALAGPYKMLRSDDGGGDAGAAVVHMAGLKFEPKDLVVRRGTEVSFVNDDVAPHTVTAEDDSVDSGILKPGAEPFHLVVNQRFAYFCAVHPSMTATVEISG